jgi:hypothetical protein
VKPSLCCEQRLAKVVPFEQMAEAAHRGLISSGSRRRSIPTKPRIARES